MIKLMESFCSYQSAWTPSKKFNILSCFFIHLWNVGGNRRPRRKPSVLKRESAPLIPHENNNSDPEWGDRHLCFHYATHSPIILLTGDKFTGFQMVMVKSWIRVREQTFLTNNHCYRATPLNPLFYRNETLEIWEFIMMLIENKETS